jgi:hypothetical protein
VYVQVAEHGAFGRTVLGAGLALFGAFKGFIRRQVATAEQGDKRGCQENVAAGAMKPVTVCFYHADLAVAEWLPGRSIVSLLRY